MSSNPHVDATPDPEICKVHGGAVDLNKDYGIDRFGRYTCQDCLTCRDCDEPIDGTQSPRASDPQVRVELNTAVEDDNGERHWFCQACYAGRQDGEPSEGGGYEGGVNYDAGGLLMAAARRLK